MASLTVGELFKYEWRIEIFLRKYQNKESFEISGGKKIKFVPNKALIEAIKKKDKVSVNSIGLLDVDGNPYAFGKLEKTAEFGGKGAGAGTAKEDIQLQSLIDQIHKIKCDTAKATVPIKIKNTTYEVADAVSTPGTPKSDFHLVDNDGKECVWISHKDGSTAKDFGQWGGMSTKEREVNSHREVQAFIKDAQKKFGKEIPRATTVARKIKDSKLKNMSVYGKDYRKHLGQQNVTLHIQGSVILKKSGKTYIFDDNKSHIEYNGDAIKGDYEPVIMVIYKGDRSQFGIKGARFSIYPKGGRKIKEMI